MVKKLQKLAEKKSAHTGGLGGLAGLGSLLDSPLAGNMRDSAQQIWAAGLGAFEKAQGEGNKLFDQLVKQGMAMQRKTQAVAEERIGDVASKMTGLAGDVGTKAGQHWDKLESIFEERVAKALNKLGVPSSKDVQALIERIDALSDKVAKVNKAPAGKTVAKPSAKKAPAKRARKATA